MSSHNDAIAQPVVEDPVDNNRIPVEARAGMIPAQCESLPSQRK